MTTPTPSAAQRALDAVRAELDTRTRGDAPEPLSYEAGYAHQLRLYEVIATVPGAAVDLVRSEPWAVITGRRGGKATTPAHAAERDPQQAADVTRWLGQVLAGECSTLSTGADFPYWRGAVDALAFVYATHVTAGAVPAAHMPEHLSEIGQQLARDVTAATPAHAARLVDLARQVLTERFPAPATARPSTLHDLVYAPMGAPGAGAAASTTAPTVSTRTVARRAPAAGVEL